MPTTFTGLLVFLALLAPGFAFLVVFERGARPTLERSVLRETATIVLASLACNTAAGVLFALARHCGWFKTPSPSKLIAEGKTYFAAHIGLVTGWALAVFLFALLAAVIAAGLLNRPGVQSALGKLTQWVVPPAGVTMDSAWWKLLKVVEPESYRRLTCTLDDETVIEGWLTSLNPSANETAERELTLSAPLRITKPNSQPERFTHGSIAISANRIQYFYVSYWDNPPKGAPEVGKAG